ncbi:ADP-ribosyltransferase [Nocardia brasiliensis]|uniref:ADP-ribosyltransferase n=1 Tax=Nocardia brasiliensis TaxID=37326 RepID=UPI002456171D|nr:ADP-ribosyltransferase [Nocardia brasiliensis]
MAATDELREKLTRVAAVAAAEHRRIGADSARRSATGLTAADSRGGRAAGAGASEPSLDAIRTGAHRRADSKPGYVINEIRRFDTDHEGEAYGEQYLSAVFRNLAAEQKAAVLEYSKHSFPYHALLRPDGVLEPQDVAGKLREFYSDVGEGWSLYELVGGKVPIMDDIHWASGRSDLTSVQERLVERIINSGQPWRELQRTIRRGAGMRGVYTAAFGAWPTVGDVEARIALIDAALKHPLPEGLQVQRSLNDVNFMLEGTSPYEIVGTIWREPGYTSTALGKNIVIPGLISPTAHVHLDVPKGVNGLWLGRHSTYSDQREILLERRLEYRITSVRREHRMLHLNATVVGP